MKVSDLKARARVDEIEVEVVAVDEPRDVTTRFGDQLRVCDCTVKDDSGEVVLTLWNDEIEKVNEGDRIRIRNGWVNSFQNKLQLSAGKYGTLEIL